MSGVVPRAALFVLAVAALSGCGGTPGGKKVLGAENRCAAAVEVSVDENLSSEAPSKPWVLIEPDAWMTLGEVSAPTLAIFVRVPKAETGQVYPVAMSALIRTTGPLDLLFAVEGQFCP